MKHVLLGAIDLTIPVLGDDCPEQFLVSEIIPHPNYKTSSRYNDIALLRINKKVTFHAYIRPACLPIASMVPDKLTAMGWGATGFAAPASDELIKVELSYYNHSECSQAYETDESFKLSLGISEETQMCAGSRLDIQDTCVVSKFIFYL